MYINKITILGNLTRDIELKKTPSGMAITEINIATNRSWKDQSGTKQDKVTYFQVKAFNKQAEVLAQYCKKGDQLYIECHMDNTNYEKDGATVYQNSFILDSFQFGNKSNKEETKSKTETIKDNSIDDVFSSLQGSGYSAADLDVSQIPF